MRILGIHLGHDSNLCFVEDGQVVSVYEPERYYKKKGYKLNAYTLDSKKIVSTYQWVNVDDFKESLAICTSKWGLEYDLIAVCGGREEPQFQNIQTILKNSNVKFKSIYRYNHHLCHACGAYFTSNFSKALILSYDGSGNDGKTLLFIGRGNEVSYFKKYHIFLGHLYNGMGYNLNIHPESSKLTSGKAMGLVAYGKVRPEWIKFVRSHITRAKSRVQRPNDSPNAYGINDLYPPTLDRISEIKPYVKRTPFWVLVLLKIFRSKIIQILVSFLFRKTVKKLKIYRKIETREGFIKFDGVENHLAKDLMATFQKVWTDIVMEILSLYYGVYKNLCITGGCALNGITNYSILKKFGWNNVHLIPNPSDCGLSIGAALKAYWDNTKKNFKGYHRYFNPYIGMELYDKENLPDFKKKYSHKHTPSEKYLEVLARLLNDGKIIGLIQDNCEIGPRALGNRSILCNPTIKDMKQILNEKVKNREWYRPFAPICTLEDSNKYFTNEGPIHYMSVICYVKEEYLETFPSITHVDGTARLQTITQEQNTFIYNLLKEFEKISGYPILLNTSLNPRGQPILNHLKISFEMIYNTERILSLTIIFYLENQKT